MTLMRKLALNFGYFQTQDMVKAKVMEADQPIALIPSGHSPVLIVMVSLIHGTTPYPYIWAPPTIQQQLEASALRGTHPDCGS